MLSLFYSLFELEVSPSDADRVLILKMNSSYDELKYLILLAYHPQMTYNNIPLHTLENIERERDLSVSFERQGLAILASVTDQLCDSVSANEQCAWFIKTCSLGDASLFKRVIKKDLECGLSVRIINEAWGDFLPDDGRNISD